MPIKCLIVEDEKLAQDVLKKYISQIPLLELVACCSNATEAFNYLHKHSVDLLFLDINMPELNGIDFLKIVENPPEVIITTAYSEFAMEGYEYSVRDYLLKPIRYERFLKAVHKVSKLNSNAEKAEDNVLVEDYIFIRQDSNVRKVLFKEILLIQALGNYLKIHLSDNKTIVTRITVNEIEAQLPESLFIRVHKSYIVSVNDAVLLDNNKISINKQIVPIGTTYKQSVTKKLRRGN